MPASRAYRGFLPARVLALCLLDPAGAVELNKVNRRGDPTAGVLSRKRRITQANFS